jgi:hypothetical protein
MASLTSQLAGPIKRQRRVMDVDGIDACRQGVCAPMRPSGEQSVLSTVIIMVQRLGLGLVSPTSVAGEPSDGFIDSLYIEAS